jgi:hypothetical protein
MKKIQIILILVFFFTTTVTGWLFNKEREERKRVESNQYALMGKLERWKTKDSLNVASVDRLVFSKKELEVYNSKLTETVKEQDIKIRRLQSITQTGVKTETVIKTVVKDSFIIVDNVVVDTFRCIDYISPYLDLSGCFGNDNIFHGEIVSRDTLTQIVHRVPKFEFWFIRLGTKGIKQNVMSSNPYSVITFSDYIELKRR